MRRIFGFCSVIALAAIFLTSVASAVGGNSGSAETSSTSHSWSNTTLQPGESMTTPDGTKVTNTGTPPADPVCNVKYCPGKETGAGAHGPHTFVDPMKAGYKCKVEANGNGATVVVGNNAYVSMGGSNNTLTTGKNGCVTMGGTNNTGSGGSGTHFHSPPQPPPPPH